MARLSVHLLGVSCRGSGNGMEQRETQKSYYSVIEKAEGNGKRRERKGFFPPIASEGDEVMESWALLRIYREAKKVCRLAAPALQPNNGRRCTKRTRYIATNLFS